MRKETLETCQKLTWGWSENLTFVSWSMEEQTLSCKIYLPWRLSYIFSLVWTDDQAPKHLASLLQYFSTPVPSTTINYNHMAKATVGSAVKSQTEQTASQKSATNASPPPPPPKKALPQSCAPMNMHCLTAAKSRLLKVSLTNFWLLLLLQWCKSLCVMCSENTCSMRAGRSVIDRQVRWWIISLGPNALWTLEIHTASYYTATEWRCPLAWHCVSRRI